MQRPSALAGTLRERVRAARARRPWSPLRLELGSVAVLLGATTVFYTSQGLTHTLVPLRAGSGGVAGWVTSAYFAGFVFGAFHGARPARRVGHVRAFGALTALTVAAVLAFPLLPPLAAWLAVRLVHGAAVAALATVVEAWLSAAASAQTRGRVLAVYTGAVYAGFGVGPLLLSVYPHTGWEAFSLAAILLCAAGTPVLLWRVDAPLVPEAPRAGVRHVLRVAPFGLAVAAASGVAGGAFTGLGPLYAVELGLESAGVGRLMSVTVLGGVALQWGIGYASDRLDRAWVMVATSAAATGLGLALALTAGLPLGAVIALLVAFEGVQLSLYPLALAHANDRSPDELDTADLASALLLAYGIGAAVGPLLAGGLSLALGATAAFVLAAGALALSALYGLAWRRRERPVPVASQGPYAALPQSSAELFGLDPATVPDAEFIERAEAESAEGEGEEEDADEPE